MFCYFIRLLLYWCSSCWLVPGDPLGSPPLVLHLVHRPHGAFHVLHAHKTLVQAQVVTHRVLTRSDSRGDVTDTG